MITQLPLFAPPQPRKARSFHTRVPIPGPASEAAQEIKRGEGKARQQEEAILAFYRANPGAWSPSYVWLQTTYDEPYLGWPITSVRRGITNLTKRGFLRMKKDRVLGQWGAMEHLWELVPAKEGNQ